MTNIKKQPGQRPDKPAIVDQRKGQHSGKELPADPNTAQERLDRETQVEPGAPANGDNVSVQLDEFHDKETANEKRQSTGSSSRGGL